MGTTGTRENYLMAARAIKTHTPDKVNIALLNIYGIFLIPVNMLGWVDALCAIYTDREELEAFVYSRKIYGF